MDITDDLLAGLGVDEHWHIDSYDDSSLASLIQLVEQASGVGVFSDLGKQVYLWIQTLHDDVIYELTATLESGGEIGVSGLEIRELVSTESSGTAQACEILARVRESVAAAAAEHDALYTPRRAGS